MIFEWDDLGANHIISDMCQSHDCRDQLDRLHVINPAFKCTLFAIPGEMTPELLEWCEANNSWIQLMVHGFYHSSNYECEQLTYDEFGAMMLKFSGMIDRYFVHGFRAPGWQLSTEAMQWLYKHDWIICDQGYNDMRRPIGAHAYVNYGGVFKADGVEVPAYHGHTWNVGWNGIYEDFEKVNDLVVGTTEFKFVSELF